jgi:outer membrane biosynthesis protein TonB
MSANDKNTVTNRTESYFRTITTTSVTIEAVDPAKEEPKATAKEEPKATAKEEPKATAKEEPKAPAKEEPKAPAKEEPKATAKEEKKRDWLRLIGTALLAALGTLLIIWLVWLLFTPKGDATSNGSVAPVTAPIDSALESPDARSAASNQNFIGYFGSRGQGWTVPSQVLDTTGATRNVGSVLYTWCETRTSCFYQVLKPGETISAGHQGSQINIYDPAYVGLEANELQYIATEANTSWTAVK